MKTIVLSFSFTASHSLAVREAPHDHLWLCVIGISGKEKNGFIFNMAALRLDIDRLIAPLKNTLLNRNPFLDNNVRDQPTCERLCDFFWDKMEIVLMPYKEANESIFLSFVEIGLCENNIEIGRVRKESQTIKS